MKFGNQVYFSMLKPYLKLFFGKIIIFVAPGWLLSEILIFKFCPIVLKFRTKRVCAILKSNPKLIFENFEFFCSNQIGDGVKIYKFQT